MDVSVVVSLVTGILTVGGLLITAGRLLARIEAQERALSELRESRERQGERLGLLEQFRAVEEHSRPYRTDITPPPTTTKGPR